MTGSRCWRQMPLRGMDALKRRSKAWASTGSFTLARARGWRNGRVFAGFLIENDVRTRIDLRERCCFGIGVVDGHGGRPPMHVAVLAHLRVSQAPHTCFHL